MLGSPWNAAKTCPAVIDERELGLRVIISVAPPLLAEYSKTPRDENSSVSLF